MKMFDAGKTRMIGLAYGEKTMTMRYAVFILYQNGRTDRQTDRQTDGRTDLLYQYRASVCRRAIKIDVVDVEYLLIYLFSNVSVMASLTAGGHVGHAVVFVRQPAVDGP